MMESLRESTSGTAMYVSTRDSRLGSPPSTLSVLYNFLSTTCRNASNYETVSLLALDIIAFSGLPSFFGPVKRYELII
jgi:hypothetical protein